MTGRKPVPWTPQERALLREIYPREGLNGCTDALPDRSWHAIQQKAHKLGLKAPVTQDAPRPKLQGEDLEKAVRLRVEQRWSFARIGASFGVSEAGACNAVMIVLCERSGHRPAKRDATGRLLPEEFERLRLMLRKGLKGVEIQLRMGISAGRIAEERRRYSAELKANGKAALPPPGGGQAYSGVKLSRAKIREVEDLYMQGLGAKKISERSGVSSTSALRIRARLVRRLARKGTCLPGCDRTGKRQRAKESTAYVPPDTIEALRTRLLAREPVKRAAAAVGIGTSSAYRIRNALRAALEARGETLPPPILPGRVRRAGAFMPWLPQDWMPRHRALVAQIGLEAATAQVKDELAAARRAAREAAKPKTFDEQLEALRRGQASLVPTFKPSRVMPDATLGGVATGMIG